MGDVSKRRSLFAQTSRHSGRPARPAGVSGARLPWEPMCGRTGLGTAGERHRSASLGHPHRPLHVCRLPRTAGREGGSPSAAPRRWHPCGIPCGIPCGSWEALGWGDSSGASPDEGDLGPKTGSRGRLSPPLPVSALLQRLVPGQRGPGQPEIRAVPAPSLNRLPSENVTFFFFSQK